MLKFECIRREMMSLRTQFLVGGMAVGLVLSGCNDEPNPEPSPGPDSSFIDSGVTEKAWESGPFYHAENNIRGYVNITQHIYEYEDELWCGYWLFDITNLEIKSPITGWITKNDISTYSNTWGRITYDNQDDLALFYGWAPQGEAWDEVPVDSSLPPGDADPTSVDFPPSMVGVFIDQNSDGAPDFVSIEDFDIRPVHVTEAGMTFDIDLPPVDLSSTPLTYHPGTILSDWCDGWVN